MFRMNMLVYIAKIIMSHHHNERTKKKKKMEKKRRKRKWLWKWSWFGNGCITFVRWMRFMLHIHIFEHPAFFFRSFTVFPRPVSHSMKSNLKWLRFIPLCTKILLYRARKRKRERLDTFQTAVPSPKQN